MILLLLSGPALDGCRTLHAGPPVVTGRENGGLMTKRARAKRQPDRPIADDLSVSWVIAEIFREIKPGDAWRCEWRDVPEGR
jgi:hypothetical protein